GGRCVRRSRRLWSPWDTSAPIIVRTARGRSRDTRSIHEGDQEGGVVMGNADSGALTGKVAVITGAATGIGRASALLFAQAGARVLLADSREPELAGTEAEVRAAGGEAASI